MEKIPAKPTILVVEDDNLVRMDTVDVFIDAGFDVIEAWSGEMAVRLLEELPNIGLVFTDIRMPGPINGIQLAQLMSRRWPGKPVMVCSAPVTPLAKQLPDKARFFAKPFDHREVSNAALQLLAA